MSPEAPASFALSLVFAVSACGGGDAAHPPQPAADKPPAYACNHGADVAPEARPQFVGELRKMMLDYEGVAGPALGGVAWSGRRVEMKARLEQADDAQALSRSVLEVEDGIARRMPASWIVRRVAWRRGLDGTSRYDVLLDGFREVVCATRNAHSLDDGRRERVFRTCARITLLIDTCLSAVR